MGQGPSFSSYPLSYVLEVRTLYESGLTKLEVGEKLGRSRNFIARFMRFHGIKARRSGARDVSGEKNGRWAGDSVGYFGMHKRLYKMFGKPNHCIQCGTTKSKHYDYANLTGRRRDPTDYAAMCRSCHMRYDKVIFTIPSMKKLAKERGIDVSVRSPRGGIALMKVASKL